MKEINMTMLRAKSFRCDEAVWKNFKLLCTINGDIMQDKLGELVEEFVVKESSKLGPQTLESVKNQVGA